MYKSSRLDLDFVLKSKVFIIPLQKGHYLVGATYNWDDKTNSVTKEAREELLEKLNLILNCDFEIVEQRAGIRPTVLDRRPLVGRHQKHANLYILNGMGTRGVIIAPLAARQLFEMIENNKALDPEINIARFNRDL